ncbi:mitochondrial basic amino acids transporter-like [Styela clava]|uniref:mitochondrial basic amino acids transporter-like n=1 Tax=Styela clava TaxID=7725 RepID=UPI001939D625|nr:mitochondrial basic amino acids transporter-like [Styela clava]XP_039258876.1 mitochondrial basic amino acids transporter-like [Styela clava]
MPMINYVEFFSGCLGGVAGVLVGQPFDTVKVRLQTQSGTSLYRGVWHCLTSIVKNESPRGLFKGMSSPLLGLSFINAIVFGVQAQVITFLGRETTYTHFISGAFAGAVQCVICAPMELAKTQMQVQGIGKKAKKSDNMYKSSIDCIKKIYKSHGMKGCYKGMTLTLMRETPAFGCYFASYDILTSTVLLVDKTETYQLGTILKMMLSGGIAGILSWVITYPFDVLKSRLQADHFENSKYKGTIDCLKKGIEKEGPRLLYRGLNSTIIRAFPVNAATFAVVQVSTQYFYKKKNGYP